MKTSLKKFLIKTTKGVYNVLIWYDKTDNAYLVKVPSLSGVVTFGRNLEEAKKMAKDAIELYCDCLIDEGKVIINNERRVYGRIPKRSVVTIR